MQKVMVLTKNDLKQGAAAPDHVSLRSFTEQVAAAQKSFDFILYQNEKDIVVLKSRFGTRRLCSLVKWIDSQSRWLSIVKML